MHISAMDSHTANEKYGVIQSDSSYHSAFHDVSLRRVPHACRNPAVSDILSATFSARHFFMYSGMSIANMYVAYTKLAMAASITCALLFVEDMCTASKVAKLINPTKPHSTSSMICCKMCKEVGIASWGHRSAK